MANILQWNLSGLQANREELDMLSSYIHPSMISLQETFLKENKIVTFKGYSSYHSYAGWFGGLGVTQGHRKHRHMIERMWLSIRL